MIIVENYQNGTILKRHRDDVKHLPRAVSNKVNNIENNLINDKYGHCHCACDCEDFARQISNGYNCCSSPSSFQDRCDIPKSRNQGSTRHGTDSKLVRKSIDQRR